MMMILSSKSLMVFGALAIIGFAGTAILGFAQSGSRDSTNNGRSAKTVAIFIHEGVELLDFAGPGEVFASSGFEVYTVAATTEPIVSQGFVTVTPQYSIDNAPAPDILVLPGGSTGTPLKNPAVIEWIRKVSRDTTVSLSVCTGAFLLAKAGLLDGLSATTFHGQIDGLRSAAPRTTVIENTRWVDNGRIVTTAGVSAGIDGALQVVTRLRGQDVAERTARYMEYDKWKPGEGTIVPEISQ
jgi:transcriptional regulator GlxA family with amidase domain